MFYKNNCRHTQISKSTRNILVKAFSFLFLLVWRLLLSKNETKSEIKGSRLWWKYFYPHILIYNVWGLRRIHCPLAEKWRSNPSSLGRRSRVLSVKMATGVLQRCFNGLRSGQYNGRMKGHATVIRSEPFTCIAVSSKRFVIGERYKWVLTGRVPMQVQHLSPLHLQYETRLNAVYFSIRYCSG